MPKVDREQIYLKVCRTGSTFTIIHLIFFLVIPIKVQACDSDRSLHCRKIVDKTGDTGCNPDIQVMLQLVYARQIRFPNPNCWYFWNSRTANVPH